MSGRLPLVALILSLAVPLTRATGLVEKTWFFTTDTTLTVDVRLGSGVEPNWAASSVRVAPLAGTAGAGVEQVQTLADSMVRARADLNVRRITVGGLKMTLWEPARPTLYRVTLELVDRAGRRERIEQRVGFRSFTTKDGQLLLNGRPIFLRGFAINPPNRGIPEELERSRGFAEDYVRYLKSLHVNIIRIPDDDTWYDVCDELGMMVFGGNYSGRVNGHGSDADRQEIVRWFREEKFHPISRHPALVIYALTNEVAGSGASGEKWDALLGEIYRQLQPWDPTRLYIANAGYGFGRVGDINDLHRYWGWYYESPFTFLHLRDYLLFPEKKQPLTFTECVGNYNGPDGRVNLTPNHKNPIAQLNWTGHAPMAEQGALEYAHQSFTTRQATELFRRLRPLNPELSGVFPFTILFNRWHDIHSFADMGPKPAAAQLRASYQPILVSWELYTPQVYAGCELKPIAHVVNDDDAGAALQGALLKYELRDATTRTVAAGELKVPDVPYYATVRLPLTLRVPETLATGMYSLHGTLQRGGAIVAENAVELFVANPSFVRSAATAAAPVRLFDPAGDTARAFQRIGVPFTNLEPSADGRVPAGAPVVIGERAADRLSPEAAKGLLDFAREGGRVVVLRHAAAALPAVARVLPVRITMPATDIDDPTYPPPPRPSRNGYYANPERPEHPVFAGIDRRQLRVWSDATGWDEQKSGMPDQYPVTDGFLLKDAGDARTTAVLANYGPGLDAMALAEFFAGKGSVLFTGFSFASRAGVDPVADRLLRNLIAYAVQADGHDAHPLITAPIVWGQYETEHGVLTGLTSGLMLNSRPALTGAYRDMRITVTPEGFEFAGGAGGWNSRPGIVYVPFGRRPFAPYVERGWSGVPEPADRNVKEGEGRFWCRIPAGRTVAVHRVFNSATEPLKVRISENGQEVTATVAAGATEIVRVPIGAGITDVETGIRGDRRLVLLETAFE